MSSKEPSARFSITQKKLYPDSSMIMGGLVNDPENPIRTVGFKMFDANGLLISQLDMDAENALTLASCLISAVSVHTENLEKSIAREEEEKYGV